MKSLTHTRQVVDHLNTGPANPPGRSKGRRKSKYGKHIHDLPWAYFVIAKPDFDPATIAEMYAHDSRPPRIEDFIRSAIKELETAERGTIRYAYTLTDEKSAHMFLGGITRLTPSHIETFFQWHRFGDVVVDACDPEAAIGCAFSSFDPLHPAHDGTYAVWQHNVSWSVNCQQRMHHDRAKLLQRLRSGVDLYTVPPPLDFADLFEAPISAES